MDEPTPQDLPVRSRPVSSPPKFAGQPLVLMTRVIAVVPAHPPSKTLVGPRHRQYPAQFASVASGGGGAVPQRSTPVKQPPAIPQAQERQCRGRRRRLRFVLLVAADRETYAVNSLYGRYVRDNSAGSHVRMSARPLMRGRGISVSFSRQKPEQFAPEKLRTACRVAGLFGFMFGQRSSAETGQVCSGVPARSLLLRSRSSAEKAHISREP